MENTCGNSETKNDLFIRVKAKKMPRFKAGPELADRVTMVAVEVSEEQTETADILDLNIHVQTRDGSKLTKADSGKA
jgi:hypothetical protein